MILKNIIKKVIKLSTKKLSAGPHITRYYMYSHLASLAKTINTDNLNNRVLSISQSLKLCKLLHIQDAEIVEANYPQYNILKLPFQDNEFDYIVCDQVLEHVEGNVQEAINESRRVLKPGGIAVFATCFMNPIHGAPGDFWRFTPDALTLLFKKFQEIIDVGGWGNKHAWFIIWLGLRFHPIPHAKWHPLHKIAVRNNEQWPIVTWIVARK